MDKFHEPKLVALAPSTYVLRVWIEACTYANWSIRAFSPPFWPGMETDPPTSGTYPGDGAARDSRLATEQHEATARGIARGHDGAARGDGDRFPSNIRVLRRLLAGNASPSSPLPHSLPGARVLARVLARLRSIRR